MHKKFTYLSATNLEKYKNLQKLIPMGSFDDIKTEYLKLKPLLAPHLQALIVIHLIFNKRNDIFAAFLREGIISSNVEANFLEEQTTYPSPEPGKNVIVKKFEDYKPLLINTAWMEDRDAFLELLKNGADIYATDLDGNKVLHFAIKYKLYDFIDICLVRGMNPNIPNKNEKSPMDLVRGVKDSKITAIFEKSGYKIPKKVSWEGYKEKTIELQHCLTFSTESAIPVATPKKAGFKFDLAAPAFIPLKPNDENC